MLNPPVTRVAGGFVSSLGPTLDAPFGVAQVVTAGAFAGAQYALGTADSITTAESAKMRFVSEKASWRCVVCGVAERDGAILLVRQENVGDPEGGWWVLPGGVVEVGESLEVALRREFLEETGVSITSLTRPLFTVETTGDRNSLTFVFAVDAPVAEVSGDLDPDGIVREVAWVDKREALARLGAVPYAVYAEPPVAVLTGRVPEGSLWTYEIDKEGGQRLLHRLPV